MAFNKKTHLRQNIDALKTAFTLDRERRAPTPEEERTLGAYSGFGAIKEVLENPTGKPDKDGMATLVAELHEVIRANTPDEREYKRYMDGIKNSVLTAFYTPPKVADAIVEAIWDTRIVPKRILDPSAGTGVFVNAVDFHDPYAEITCFEKDPATGLILNVTRNFAASLFRNIKYFTLRKLYLCRKWMQKRLQKTTTTGITLPNFDFLA